MLGYCTVISVPSPADPCIFYQNRQKLFGENTGDCCRLTKVEWDILDAYVQKSYPGPFKMFDNLMCMKKKGYFKNVDPGKELKEILKNCVVI